MSKKAFLIILLVTTVARLPWINHLEIDWDEATYLLAARDIRAGNLPYTNLWEIKPPLAFLPYVLFGYSVLSLRIGIILWITAASFFVYLTLRKSSSFVSALTGALSVSVFSSFLFDRKFIADGQAVFTEHAALLPTAMCFYFLSRKQNFLVGLCCGAFCFMRPALAFMGLAIANINIRRMVGLGVIPLLLVAVYFLTGNLDVFFHTNYTIPQAVQAGRPLSFSSELVTRLGESTLFMLENGWWFFIPGLLLSKQNNLYVWVSLALAAFGIFYSGSDHHHYFLQLIVPLALISGSSRAPRLIFSLFVLVCLQFAYLTPKSLRLTEPTPILAIHEKTKDAESLLCLSAHVLYFMQDRQPPIKAIHPSVYGKDFILEPLKTIGISYDTETIFEHLLRPFPEYIVKKGHVWYLTNYQKAYLQNVLDQHYDLAGKYKQDLRLYKLKSSS